MTTITIKNGKPLSKNVFMDIQELKRFLFEQDEYLTKEESKMVSESKKEIVEGKTLKGDLKGLLKKA